MEYDFVFAVKKLDDDTYLVNCDNDTSSVKTYQAVVGKIANFITIVYEEDDE